MVLYPEVQQKAQAELDSIIEPGRLPDSSDRPRLPYNDTLVQEIYRWNPVAPLALPHKATEDDVYEGYHIPAGATVLANNWAIFHDPSLYPDPFNVVPERYLGQTTEHINPDPRTFAFGYGRRVCPGQSLAEDTIFSVVAAVLSIFSISKAIGPDGAPIEPEVSYTGGSLSHPNPFECRIIPRSGEAERLITNIAVMQST